MTAPTTNPSDPRRPLGFSDAALDDVWLALSNAATARDLVIATDERIDRSRTATWEMIITSRWARLLAAPDRARAVTALDALASAVTRARDSIAASIPTTPEPEAAAAGVRRPALYRSPGALVYHLATCRWCTPTMREWTYRLDLPLAELPMELAADARDAGRRAVRPCRYCLPGPWPEQRPPPPTPDPTTTEETPS